MDFANINIEYIIFGMLAFILSGSIHEFSHAYSAYILGDGTPGANGRLTLNPIAHIDPWGSIFFPLVGAISGLPVLGWMKPVPVNPHNFRNPSRDDAVVSFAGPFSNLLQASLALIIIKLFHMAVFAAGITSNIIVTKISLFLTIYLSTNICLMVFNLLPVPPLDGGWILRHFLPDSWKEKFDAIYRYGFIILYILVLTNVFEYVFTPIVNSIYAGIGILYATNIFIISLPFLGLCGLVGFFMREEISLAIKKMQKQSALKIIREANNSKPETMPGFFKPGKTVIKPEDTVPEGSYERYTLEYQKETEAKSVWMNCSKNPDDFRKFDQACIKCDKYIKCLSQSLKKADSPGNETV